MYNKDSTNINMDILLFGIQGSGKGTQARALSLALNIPIFEAGAELRKLATHDNEEGKTIRELINRGALVPKGIVLMKVADFLDHPATIDGVIFDGVPRLLEQAVAFQEMMETKHRDTIAILIDLDEDSAVYRVTNRRICSRCQQTFPPEYLHEVCNSCGGILIHRADDERDAIQKRIKNFYQETVPVIDHYRTLGKLLTVDGNQSVIDVTKDIFNQLSPLLKINHRKLEKAKDLFNQT